MRGVDGRGLKLWAWIGRDMDRGGKELELELGSGSGSSYTRFRWTASSALAVEKCSRASGKSKPAGSKYSD